MSMFPRTFDALKEFGNASNKFTYVNVAFDSAVDTVEKSISGFPQRTWTQWAIGTPRANPKQLYRIAMYRDIKLDDILLVGGMTEERFIETFVATNIFRPAVVASRYTFQFDVYRLAAIQVCAV